MKTVFHIFDHKIPVKKVLFSVCLFSILTVTAQWNAKEYDNGHGGKIRLPQGDISFADKLILYQPGNPAPLEANRQPSDALGAPDFNVRKITGFVSLGTGGILVVSFNDNALVNIEGPDLYIFEVGRYVEETILSVSKDGKKWVTVGRISGGNALVDIGDSTRPGEIFTFVKLQDLGTASAKGDHMWPGADIDAIAAIGSAKQLSLNAKYLFNTGQSVIKPGARKNLDSIIQIVREDDFEIVINGHTDRTGSRKFNQQLSEDRAASVRNYFIQKLPSIKSRIKINGYAGDVPVAPNTSPEGRELNRRVEVFFIPVLK
jgi:outer membrane protein OmpA-like peptidoglycan-associated protein